MIPSSISQLGRRTPHQSNHTRRINHTPLLLSKLPHTHHRILTPPPHALDINPHGQIPNLLFRLNGVGVLSVHDPGVVEHDIDAAPGIELVNGGGDVGFFADVAGEGFEGLVGGNGDYGMEFFDGGC